MNKILAIAANPQHLINYCRDKDIPLERFVHGNDVEKMRELDHGYRYIVVTKPYNCVLWDEIQREFRIKHAIRLPLDINQWAITEFA